MPTYQEILATDLSTLITAVTQWDEMAGKFKEHETLYHDKVHTVTLPTSWVGESSRAANAMFDITLNEYKKAQTEAKAMASLLRDAHTQFVDLRKKVESERDAAIKDGMTVSSTGHVTFDTSKLDQSELSAYHHDPDYQRSAQEKAGSWQSRIDNAVRSVCDADEGFEVALTEVVKDSVITDGTSNGFNGQAKGDIEQYEADEGKDIALRVDSGDATAHDYQELQRLFRDNAGDKVFSQTLLDNLGADGTLKLSNSLDSLAYYKDKKQSGQYLDIQKGLATTLSTATKDPDSAFYKHFRSEMQKAGTEEFKLDGLSKIPNERVRGYQSLVTLMQHGDGYSGQFLKDTADDIRHAEVSYTAKGNLDSVWALRDKFSGGDRGWFANDPLDGVLGIMSHDPATSTAYLDPAHSDNLKYLLHGRDWDTVVDHFATPPGGTTQGMAVTAEDGDVRKGFGAALEAATTGNAPGAYHPIGHHTTAQASILQQTIDTLSADNHAQKLPKNLTEPLAHILTSYTADTHQTFANDASAYQIPKDDPGRVWSDKDGAHMAVSTNHLAQLMRGIADDPEAFGHLYGAEQKYSHDVLAAIPQNADNITITNRIAESSRAIGGYDAIRSDIIFDERFKKTQWAADFNHGIGSSLSTALMFNPVSSLSPVGDAATKAVDLWTYESNKEHTAEANLAATSENAKTYEAGQRDAEHMVRLWGQSRGHDIDSDYTKFILRGAQDEYDKGRNGTLIYLRADR
ncbi:hypothetical protein [Streptomyces violascens]|uniref:Uncharacterized protein n=1 Tax=Streptomyces violascens TaxID=67381 RepID=A0ABQ3QKV8_9ACTN|nr:hypothetical protein [Streptomyces violascens]GGT92676.1 hypothetical protein GCM10010289_10770 [Streptomyces violascens]GHI37874.1 hypothetical protein Sviol_22820 [Streptomyces violascens]